MTKQIEQFGSSNLFPAISPIIVLIITLAIENIIRARVSEGIHQVVFGIMVMFLYSALFLPILSHLSFKYAILPAVRFISRKMKIKSYALNCTILLFVIHIAFVFSFGVSSWPLDCLITLFLAFNCCGHFFVNYLLKRNSTHL